MRSSSESSAGSRSAEARRVVLICEECGERLVLGGPEEVWLSTRTLFECECGKGVSLASRLDEKDSSTGAKARMLRSGREV